MSLFVSIQYYPLEEVLAAEYLLEEFRPDLIQMVLDKLRPEHVRSVSHDRVPAHGSKIHLILPSVSNRPFSQ